MERYPPSKIENLDREIKKYSIVAFIACRSLGSSKKARALWKVCDKSMLQRSIEVASACNYIDRIYVATEDEEIMKEAKRFNARVIPRPISDVLDYPKNLTTGINKLIKPRSMIHQNFVYLSRPWNYSIQYLHEVENYTPDIYLILSVDNPLTTTDSIKRLIEAYFSDPEASAAVTVYQTEPKWFIENNKTGRLFPIFNDAWQGIDRQKYPNVYRLAGPKISGGWISRSAQTQCMAWIEVNQDEGLCVHNKRDLFLANCLMKWRQEKQNE